MRSSGTLLLVLPLVAAATIADARILGSGSPKKSDCYMTFEGATGTGKGHNVIECTDNEPFCDGDAVEGQCTFYITVCVAQTNTGIAGCTPGTVTRISGARGLELPTLPASTPTCAAKASKVVVKLKKNRSSNKRLFNMLAIATVNPKRDPDKLILKCNKRISSTPAGAFVWK